MSSQQYNQQRSHQEAHSSYPPDASTTAAAHDMLFLKSPPAGASINTSWTSPRLMVGGALTSPGLSPQHAAHTASRSAIGAGLAEGFPQMQNSGQLRAQQQPQYVNAKQYQRIIKRRASRQRFQERLAITRRSKLEKAHAKKDTASRASEGGNFLNNQPYQHESRHRHAMRRPRGPGGRFLTSREIQELKERGELPSEPEASKPQSQKQETPVSANKHKDNDKIDILKEEAFIATPSRREATNNADNLL